MYLILMVKISRKNAFNVILFVHLDNKQLDRKEYNLWTIRTTGEEITNEDWLSVRGKIFLKFLKRLMSLC
jgi:hypothetical protein